MDRLAMLKEDLLSAYEVRKTWAQKSAFIEWARGYASEMDVQMTVEESGKLLRSRNLVFGDAESAETLITAHYDTCARLPFPNFITPQCWPVFLLTQVIPWVLVFGVLGVTTGYCVGQMVDWMPLSASLLAQCIVVIVLFGMLALMIFGPANPHTANDNTSGVTLALLAMEALRDRDDVAFVLFDNEEKGMLGSAAFVKRHSRAAKRAFVVNLDCVSDGGTMLYAGSKAGLRSAQGVRLLEALRACAQRYGKTVVSGTSPGTFYPSDQMAFAKGTAFAALRGNRILYMGRIHTPRDTVFEDDNLRCLLEALRQGI